MIQSFLPAILNNYALSDLRNINLANVEVNQRGVWVKYPGNEEGQGEDGRKDDNGFLVPFSHSESGVDPGPCLASIVIEYLDRLRSFLPDLDMDATLFHKTLKGARIQRKTFHY